MRVRVRVQVRVRVRVRVRRAVELLHLPTSPLHLPYISPWSCSICLHLPYVSPTSRRGAAPSAYISPTSPLHLAVELLHLPADEAAEE